MKNKFAALIAGAGFLLGAVPMLMAHHSFQAEYDIAKKVEFHGKFVKIDWVNPHSWIYFETTDENGKTAVWKAETPPPNILYRNGWRQNMLKPGEAITVTGNLAKDGDNLMWASDVTLEDGRKFTMGSRPDQQK